jgi:hypothetical protein
MNHKHASAGESSSLIILIVLLLLLLNPFQFWMPTVMQTVLIALVFVVFLILVLFVIGRDVQDERERMHRMFSDRVALLVGSSVLIFSLIISSISKAFWQHCMDTMFQPWVVISLSAMALSKYIALIYARKRM